MELEKVRLDKWLWAVRIFKTRALAMHMCKNGRISIGGQRVKSSRMVTAGDRVYVSKDGITYEYEVLKCIDKRVGAKEADLCKKDLTSQSELDKLQMIKSVYVPRRPKGMGRPTKKDRRDMDRYI